MNYAITMALRRYLDAAVTEVTTVKVMFDGQELTGTAKPFLTVEYLQDTNELLSAGFTSYDESYFYQVGLFARDISERMKLHEVVKTALRNPEGIPVVNDDGTQTGERFLVTVEGFTPLSNDDSANDTFKHRGYFDISVDLLRNTGDATFTQ